MCLYMRLKRMYLYMRLKRMYGVYLYMRFKRMYNYIFFNIYSFTFVTCIYARNSATAPMRYTNK